MRSLIIPILLLLMPLAEIAAFILVGRELGIGLTLLLVLASAVSGAILLRIQGLGALKRLQQAAQAGTDPGRQLVHGLMIVIAGFLLVLPGFISDAIGLLLFIPAVRDLAWGLIKSRVSVVSRGRGGGFGFDPRPDSRGSSPAGPRVIDLDDEDFSRDEDEPKRGPADRDRLR